jgi:hypothetical protein
MHSSFYLKADARVPLSELEEVSPYRTRASGFAKSLFEGPSPDARVRLPWVYEDSTRSHKSSQFDVVHFKRYLAPFFPSTNRTRASGKTRHPFVNLQPDARVRLPASQEHPMGDKGRLDSFCQKFVFECFCIRLHTGRARPVAGGRINFA